MIGFVSALSASLAIMVLVVLSALIGYVQSILPSSGMIKINEYKYRYFQTTIYLDAPLINEVVMQIEQLGMTNQVESYQSGCDFGFNHNDRQAFEVSTFNYLTLNNYFGEKVKIGNINVLENKETFNACYVDINLKQ